MLPYAAGVFGFLLLIYLLKLNSESFTNITLYYSIPIIYLLCHLHYQIILVLPAYFITLAIKSFSSTKNTKIIHLIISACILIIALYPTYFLFE